MFTLPRAAADALRAAVPILEKGGAKDLAAKTTAAANDIEGHGGSATLAALDLVASRRGEIEREFQAAKPGDGALAQHLSHGDFAAAAAIVAPPPAADHAAPLAAPVAIPHVHTPLGPAPAPPAVKPLLRMPPLLPLNQTARANLDWGGAAVPANVAWAVEPANAATFANDNATGADVRPARSGFMTVSATANNQTVAASAYAGDVTDTEAFAQIEQHSSRTNHVVWAVTAALTGVTGYFIFEKTWVGTAPEFFAAFAWGFFGTFGLDRLREAVRPVTSRTLLVP